MKKDHDIDEDGYTDDRGEGPSAHAIIVKDFLPPPEVIARAIEKKKMTIQISKTAADFFMEEARKNRVPYQRMIREVLDEYVRRMRKKPGAL